MNRNNLSWVDNKVLNNPGSAQNRSGQAAPSARPAMDTMPAQYQAMPANQNQTSVSPSTYQAPMSNMQNLMGVSPETYQAPAAKAPEQTGLSPAAYQEPAAKVPSQTGLSPAAYQNDPATDPARMGVSMPVRQNPGTQGSLTRDEAYDSSPFNVQGPPTVMSPGYTPAYLKTQIGKRVRAEFNIGSNLYIDKTGVMKEVGVNYFVLEDNVTHAMIMCDLYSLRFLTSL
jgi:hypothetical protein